MMKPTVVTLCGSTRFGDQFRASMLHETLEGKIVLTVGCMTHSDSELEITDEMKEKLDQLHLRKIDLSDEILVLNVDGYIGESTRGELAYAIAKGIPHRFLEPRKGEQWLENNRTTMGQLVAEHILAHNASRFKMWANNAIDYVIAGTKEEAIELYLQETGLTREVAGDDLDFEIVPDDFELTDIDEEEIEEGRPDTRTAKEWIILYETSMYLGHTEG